MNEPKRTLPIIPVYRGGDPELRVILSKMREAIERLGADDFETDKDIKCKNLKVYGDAEINNSLVVDGTEI